MTQFTSPAKFEPGRPRWALWRIVPGSFSLKAQIYCLCLVLGLPLSAMNAMAGEPVRIVVNDSIPLNLISRSELRSIFSMHQRRLSDGTPLTVFVLPDQDKRHYLFTKQILNLLPYVLRDTWDRQVFTGTGKAPIVVESQEELLRLLSQTVGGIGYIVGSERIPYDHVKIIEIN